MSERRSKNERQINMSLQDIGSCVQNLLTILNLIRNKDPHFDNKKDNQVSFKNHEEVGCRHDLDLLNSLHLLCVSCHTRNECKVKNVCLWPSYLNSSS